MRETWRKYLSARAPRYTSYPSVLQFDETVDAARYAEKLRSIDAHEPLSFYVHIPFCRQLCWYCGCNMRVENRYERALAYVDAVIDELRLVGDGFLAGRGRPVSAHFGGGTPNYLHCDDLVRILKAIDLEFGLADEAQLAIELDPRLIGGGDIDRLTAAGFNRMSLGVQDFDADVQQAINRRQSFDLVEAGVRSMRKAGVNDVSFDLIYGLPRQTLQGFAKTIAQAIALSPDRLSIFGYAHLPSALSRQKMIVGDELPDARTRADLAALADEMLVAAGYCRIGFDHYAKPGNALSTAMREGRLRRNFQGFTDDIAETVLGFGASAISFVDGVYVQNQKRIPDYLSAIAGRALPTAKGFARTARDRLYSVLISNLLCTLSADLSDIRLRLGEAEFSRICRALEPLERDGIVLLEGGLLKISPDARSLCRVVAGAIDPYMSADRELARAV